MGRSLTTISDFIEFPIIWLSLLIFLYFKKFASYKRTGHHSILVQSKISLPTLKFVFIVNFIASKFKRGVREHAIVNLNHHPQNYAQLCVEHKKGKQIDSDQTNKHIYRRRVLSASVCVTLNLT